MKDNVAEAQNPVTAVEQAALEQQSHRKMWTRQEAAKLAEILPGRRYELIEGDLINKTGQSPPHAYVITIMSAILSRLFPGRVRTQLPIALPEPEGMRSEPEPDLVLLHRESSEFFERHPGPDDIALVIEVSDTTLQMDRELKGRLYARCGIQVYWIIDVQQRRVITFELPGPDEYKSVDIYEGDEEVPMRKGLFFAVKVSELFGQS